MPRPREIPASKVRRGHASAAAGPESAESFDALVEALAPRVQRFLTRIVDDRHAVEDVLQDTFAHALLARERPPLEQAPPWIFRIARNLALDHLRRVRVRRSARAIFSRLRTQSDIPGSPGERDAPEASMNRQELQVQVHQAIKQLSEPYRTAFVLREEQELSYEEIAQVVGSSAKTVSTRIHRARKLLREALAGRSGFEHWGAQNGV